jgi:hypothetical protein
VERADMSLIRASTKVCPRRERTPQHGIDHMVMTISEFVLIAVERTLDLDQLLQKAVSFSTVLVDR